MKKTITPGLISQNNLKLIYHYIYQESSVSQQDIAYDLRLSRPTVASKISELETKGLIRKEGQISSDLVGRKAAAYSIVPDYRVSVGVEFLHSQIKLLMVDLTGAYSHRTVYDLKYENSESYQTAVCDIVNSFIKTLPVQEQQILGIGFSIPGLVNVEGTEVTYGRILDCTGMSIDNFSRHLSRPCRFLHDASAAADSEMWASPELPDFIYLNISVHLGAAMVHNREILVGRHGYSATIEHIQMVPRGKICYCGKTGCAETVCSMNALLQDEDADTFFECLREGRAAYRKRWSQFLHYLALSINNMHLLYDTDFVLGGYLAAYLKEEDIQTIYDEIEQMTPFPEVRDYIRISKMPKHNITIGAALPYIREFLGSDLTDD